MIEILDVKPTSVAGNGHVLCQGMFPDWKKQTGGTVLAHPGWAGRKENDRTKDTSFTGPAGTTDEWPCW